jgi:hypothetical protein
MSEKEKGTSQSTGNADSMKWGVKNPGKVANQAPPGAGKGKIGPNLTTKVRK